MIALFAAPLLVGFTRSQITEVPFRIGDEAIIVDAVVNGRKTSCMFDTGFAGAFVLSDDLNVGAASGSMTLRDFVGEFRAQTVKLKSIRLGGMAIKAEDMEIVQQPMAHLSFSYNTHTDGIMGLEVVRDHVLEINFEHSKFIFHPKNHDISKLIPDNKRTFMAKMLPIGHNSIELEVAAPSGKKMTLALDTGNAFYATTHKDVLERVGLWEAGKKAAFMRTAWVASGPVDSWFKSMDDLTIFGVPVKSSVWSIIDLPSASSEGDGTVGFGFLKNFNITIDLERRRVWFENWTGKVGSEPEADIGISAAFDQGAQRVTVHRVTPGSPAEKAGIQRDDAILSVDGIDLADVGPRRLEKIFLGPVGSKVQLAISRQGNLMRLEVAREILVNGLRSKNGE